MKQTQIPYYTDPDDFENAAKEVRYPCTTQFMRYDTLTSRYRLTVQTLEEYAIKPSNDNPKALEQFIEEISDDLYGVMARLAPFNYQYNCWLVAQSLSRQFPNRYAARKQFERALVYQAQYRVKNIDVRELNGIDLDGGQSIYHKQLRKELRHISPKSLDILQSLGLLFNGTVPGKHLINYAEGM